jgi:hypothetical protein
MSIDFEERLRSEMAAVEVRPRPGLVREAYRTCQRRRRVTRAVAAAGTAAVTAGGTAAGLGAASGGGGAVPVETAAYVVSHVTGALAANDTISYSDMTLRVANAAHPGLQSSTWAYGAWGHDRQTRYLTATLAGQPSSDESDVDTWSSPGGPGTDRMTQVDYRARTVTRATWNIPAAPGKQAPGCGALISPQALNVGKALTFLPTDSISGCLRSLLASRQLSVAGHQRVQGIDAIKIIMRPPDGTITLWIDPATYLPVQLLNVPRAGSVGVFLGPATGALLDMQAEFRWLPATPANLARLTAPIPAGFTVSG